MGGCGFRNYVPQHVEQYCRRSRVLRESWYTKKADLKLHLKTGYYKYPEDILFQLARSLDRKLKKRLPPYTLSYSEHTRKATLSITEPVVIRFSEKHRQLLGFETGYFSKPGVFRSRLPVDINQGLYAIYIYCDLLGHRVVGDTLAPLFSIVPVDGQHGDTVYRRYEKMHYFPVQKKNFDDIHNTLRDDQGAVVPFNSGKVLVSLHFRKQKQSEL